MPALGQSCYIVTIVRLLRDYSVIIMQEQNHILFCDILYISNAYGIVTPSITRFHNHAWIVKKNILVYYSIVTPDYYYKLQ